MNRLSTLVTVLLMAGSLLLLAGDIVQILYGGLLWTILLWLAFICFGAGLLLLPVAFSLNDRPLVMTGAACAFVGCFAGASMQVFFRIGEVLRSAGRAAALSLLDEHTLLRLSTLVPGIFFPLGLLVLSAGFMRSRRLPLRTSLTLALGAILFPIGHAANFVPALILGDLVLVTAFFSLFLDRKSI